MRVTPAQVLPLMLLLVCMFGCKGAGQVLQVAGVVAITAVRVAALAAAASSHNHPEAGSGYAPDDGTGARRRAAEIDANSPGGCTELFVETVPPPAAGTAPPRAADCGGNMLIQDSEGRWRRYGKDTTPATEEP